MEVKEIELSKIQQLENVRMREHEHEELAELMSSIRHSGLIQPIGVAGNDKNGYLIVWGNRRFEAVAKLGWKTIPAAILDEKMDEEDFIVINTVENVQRKESTVIELGRACHSLTRKGLSQSEIAARLGIPKSRIMSAMFTFGQIPEEYNNLVLSFDHARAKDKKGKIASSVAHVILTLARSNGLNKRETKILFDLARQEETSKHQITLISNLIREGMDVYDAIKEHEKYDFHTFKLAFNKKQLKKYLELNEKKGRGIITDMVIEAIIAYCEDSKIVFVPKDKRGS